MKLSWENTLSLMMRPKLAANKIWAVFAGWLLMIDTSDFLRGSDKGAFELQISFVQCSCESLFLKADWLVEKCCV